MSVTERSRSRRLRKWRILCIFEKYSFLVWYNWGRVMLRISKEGKKNKHWNIIWTVSSWSWKLNSRTWYIFERGKKNKNKANAERNKKYRLQKLAAEKKKARETRLFWIVRWLHRTSENRFMKNHLLPVSLIYL